MSQKYGGERYIKSFDRWHHLLKMLYAVIMRFDSLREIEASMLAEVRKLAHVVLKPFPDTAHSLMQTQGVPIQGLYERTVTFFRLTAEEMPPKTG